MDDLEEIRAQRPHELAELMLARADVGDDLRQLDRVGRGGGAGVEEDVSLDVHRSLPIHKYVEDKWCVPVARERIICCLPSIPDGFPPYITSISRMISLIGSSSLSISCARWWMRMERAAFSMAGNALRVSWFA